MDDRNNAKNTKILVVEDDYDTSSFMKYLLKDVAVCDIVDNGNDAMHKFDRTDYDLAVLDFLLPDMTGIDILKVFKKRKPEVPIIMLTGYIDPCLEAYENRCDIFLFKPVDISTFKKRVKTLLAENEAN